MGRQELIQGAFRGKVGRLCGEKWKGLHTIKMNAAPTNPNSAAQQRERAHFGDFNKIICPNLEYLRENLKLDYKRMSLHNKLISMNAAFMQSGNVGDMVLTPKNSLGLGTIVGNPSREEGELFDIGTTNNQVFQRLKREGWEVRGWAYCNDDYEPNVMQWARSYTPNSSGVYIRCTLCDAQWYYCIFWWQRKVDGKMQYTSMLAWDNGLRP